MSLLLRHPGDKQSGVLDEVSEEEERDEDDEEERREGSGFKSYIAGKAAASSVRKS